MQLARGCTLSIWLGRRIYEKTSGRTTQEDQGRGRLDAASDLFNSVLRFESVVRLDFDMILDLMEPSSRTVAHTTVSTATLITFEGRLFQQRLCCIVSLYMCPASLQQRSDVCHTISPILTPLVIEMTHACSIILIFLHKSSLQHKF